MLRSRRQREPARRPPPAIEMRAPLTFQPRADDVIEATEHARFIHAPCQAV
jgi:hypothetical protein